MPLEAVELDIHSSSVGQLENELYESLKLRVLNIHLSPVSVGIGDARFAVLFSGGLDCTVLARMAHDLVPADQSIDLLNVAFENPRVIEASRQGSGAILRTGQSFEDQREISGSCETLVLAHAKGIATSSSGPAGLIWAYESCPDRITGRKAFKELQQVCPGRKWKFVAVIGVQSVK